MSNKWVNGKLGDFITLQRGYDLPAYERAEGTVPVITSSGINGTHSISKAKGPGVVMGRYGTIGQIFYIENDYWPHNTSLFVKDFKGNQPQFIYYFLKTLHYQAHNDKSSVPGLNRNDLHLIDVFLPPLPEQRAIAEILGSLDDKIEANRRQNETLEATARAIFQSWFVDFDPVHAKARGETPSGMDAETAALFPDSFEESALRLIPHGWGVGTVEDLCLSISNGGTPRRQEMSYWNAGDISWFKTGELSDSPLISSQEKITRIGLENSSCKEWDVGTVLIALYASPTVGRLGILEIQGTANQACSGLIPKDQYGSLFLFFTLLFARDQLQSYAVGAAQQNINKAVLSNLPVLLPPNAITRNFKNATAVFLGLWSSNLRESRTLAETRDALLPRLVSGELRVGEVDLNADTGLL